MHGAQQGRSIFPAERLSTHRHQIPQRKGPRGPGNPRKLKDDEYRSDLIEKSDMINERFVAYYKAQNLVPEDEWESLMDSMRSHLPTTFRVAGSRECVVMPDST